ncbi:MAG: sigma-70 family RNA polymerase sigma factor [bacterium]|nr:sigma-70 family RNA polymerase sigma factor [bacterium]
MQTNMQTVVKLPRTAAHTNTHRHTVMETIRVMYPVEKFPAKHYPDIHSILFNLFIETIKPREDSWALYCSGSEENRVKELSREILNFKNLLKNHPQGVVLVYQKYIEKFIAFKHSSQAEREDIFQEVLTRLIEDKIYKIRDRYDFNFNKISSFTSYFMVSVRNIYIDIMRERSVRPLTAGGLQEIDDVADLHGDKTMINRLVLNEELVKLQTILLLYYKSRARLELCLKLKYRVPVLKEDIEKCFPRCTEEDVDTLAQDFKFARDKGVFEKILSVFNYHEARENKSDSLRKWVNVKVDEIITHLNRTHGANVYNNKNFADFVALYYQYGKGDDSAAKAGVET